MVAEEILNGCVCLSAPFRNFTGKRRRQGVCNNISPSPPPPSFYNPHPLALGFSVFFAAAILENLLAVVIVTDGRGGFQAFINNSTREPDPTPGPLLQTARLFVLVFDCMSAI